MKLRKKAKSTTWTAVYMPRSDLIWGTCRYITFGQPDGPTLKLALAIRLAKKFCAPDRKLTMLWPGTHPIRRHHMDDTRVFL